MRAFTNAKQKQRIEAFVSLASFIICLKIVSGCVAAQANNKERNHIACALCSKTICKEVKIVCVAILQIKCCASFHINLSTAKYKIKIKCKSYSTVDLLAALCKPLQSQPINILE